MSLFMDHFRRLRILADPPRITNQFSWLLVLMIASIRAMNGDVGLSILISPLMMQRPRQPFPRSSSLRALAIRSARNRPC